MWTEQHHRTYARVGGRLLDKIRKSFPWLELVWADSGYNAHQVNTAVAKVPTLRIEIVNRSDDLKGFVLLPRRWVVERTFSWFGRNRRLAKGLGKPRNDGSRLRPSRVYPDRNQTPRAI